MSKYLAYPFLYDKTEDLRCDFEIMTDEISSTIGLLRADIKDTDLRDELEIVNELMYHINPTLRTHLSVTNEELLWLEEKGQAHKNATKGVIELFTLPQGCREACLCHIIRTKCKALVRLVSRHKQQGNEVDDLLLDFINLFSGYFFVLGLRLNQINNVKEKEFISRNY